MIITIENEKANYILHYSKRREKGRGDVYTVEKKIGFRWNGKRLFIPVGFESDGASVPRLLWGIVFPAGDMNALRAAFAHDFVYREHPEGWTKKDADKMFYDILLRDGVQKWRSWLAYKGVRIFGLLAWKTHGGY